MSYLTQPFEELQRAAIAALEGEGFDYDPLTTEFPAYLATCLGDANAHKTKSVPQMIADINTSLGGSLSHLTSSVAHLFDGLGALVVPEIFAEFASGVYEHNGLPVAVTDIFIGDEVNWGPFNAGKAIIGGTGLRNVDNDSGYLSVHPDRLGTLASVGCSIVVELFLVGVESALSLCSDGAPAWNQDIEVIYRTTSVGSYVNGVTTDSPQSIPDSTLVKVGVTYLSDRTKICITGGTVFEDTFVDAGARSFIAFTAPTVGYFKSIAIYPPLSDAHLQIAASPSS